MLYKKLLNEYTLCTDVSFVPVRSRDCQSIRVVKLSAVPGLLSAVPCQDGLPPVPKNIFVVNKNGVVSAPLTALAREERFQLCGFNDVTARMYVSQHCGRDARDAYDCLAPPSYRADLFRFCALYAQGGIYFDSDIVPAVGLYQLYNRCENVTAGADGHTRIQMKILAARPKNPGIKCALDTVIAHVKQRFYGESDLEVSGPMMLAKCLGGALETNVSLLYVDTRDALFPHYGLRNNRTILAYETPSKKHFQPQDDDYNRMWKEKRVYQSNCLL